MAGTPAVMLFGTNSPFARLPGGSMGGDAIWCVFWPTGGVFGGLWFVEELPVVGFSALSVRSGCVSSCESPRANLILEERVRCKEAVRELVSFLLPRDDSGGVDEELSLGSSIVELAGRSVEPIEKCRWPGCYTKKK